LAPGQGGRPRGMGGCSRSPYRPRVSVSAWSPLTGEDASAQGEDDEDEAKAEPGTVAEVTDAQGPRGAPPPGGGCADALCDVFEEMIGLIHRMPFAEWCEQQMYMNSKGDVIIPGIMWSVGPLVFFGLAFFCLPLVALAYLRVLCCRPAERRPSLCGTMAVGTALLALLSTPLSTLALLLQAHGSGRTILYDWVNCDVLSGVEVCMPLLPPCLFAYYVTVQFYEFMVAKQLYYHIAEEFEELGMFGHDTFRTRCRKKFSTMWRLQNHISSSWTLDPDLTAGGSDDEEGTATTETQGVAEQAPTRDPITAVSESSRSGALRSKHTVAYLKAYIRKVNAHLKYHPDDGEQESIFLEQLALLDEDQLDVRRDGGKYVEGLARASVGPRRYRLEPGLQPTARTVLLIALNSAAIAMTPAVWMRLAHPGTYLASPAPAVTWCVAVTSAASIFVLAAATVFTAASRWKSFTKVTLRLIVILYLSSTNISRRFMYRVCLSYLQDVRVDSTPIAHADPELQVADTSAHREQLLLHDLVFSMRQNRLFCREADIRDAACNRHRVQREVQEISFSSLDVNMFMHMRMWLKIDVTMERIRMQNILAFAGFALLLSLLAQVLSAMRWKGVTCVSVMWLWVVLHLGGFIILALGSAVFMNTVLTSMTIEILLAWKDRIRKRFLRSQEAVSLNLFTDTRLHLDNYFRTLIEPLDHVIEQIERSEMPVTFFTIPITESLSNKFMIVILSTAASLAWRITQTVESPVIGTLIV